MKPQLEHGFARIANATLEALAKVNIPPYEWRVLMFVFRITYGWRSPRKEAETSTSQIARVLGLDRRHIQRAVKSMAAKKLIKVRNTGSNQPGKGLVIGFQKDPGAWTVNKTVNNRLSPAPKLAQAHAPKLAHPPAPKPAQAMFSKPRF